MPKKTKAQKIKEDMERFDALSEEKQFAEIASLIKKLKGKRKK